MNVSKINTQDYIGNPHLALDLFSNQNGEPTCKIFGPGSMCESKDSMENPGLEANNGNVAHKRRLDKLWEK